MIGPSRRSRRGSRRGSPRRTSRRRTTGSRRGCASSCGACCAALARRPYPVVPSWYRPWRHLVGPSAPPARCGVRCRCHHPRTFVPPSGVLHALSKDEFMRRRTERLKLHALRNYDLLLIPVRPWSNWPWFRLFFSFFSRRFWTPWSPLRDADHNRKCRSAGTWSPRKRRIDTRAHALFPVLPPTRSVAPSPQSREMRA